MPQTILKSIIHFVTYSARKVNFRKAEQMRILNDLVRTVSICSKFPIPSLTHPDQAERKGSLVDDTGKSL